MKIDELNWKDYMLSVFHKKQQLYNDRRYPLLEINRLTNDSGGLFKVLFNHTNFHDYCNIENTKKVKIMEQDGFEKTSCPFDIFFSVVFLV